MRADRDAAIRDANLTRYRVGQSAGHYESFFQRANHPTRPLAFWIRYTIFSPAKRPADAVGELWAIYFDGQSGAHVAVKQVTPLARCRFDPAAFDVAVDDARLGPGALTGAASSGGHDIAWDLTYHGTEPPLFLLPLDAYARRLPRAKSLVGMPLATYDGTLMVDGRAVDVAAWVGSQNHNWGSRHTDHYAWGQVAGFDAHPESFLEVATARIRFGPLWTPPMTPLVLRHEGEEITLNNLAQMRRASATLRYFDWTFASENAQWRVEGHLSAPRSAVVGLRYDNPPGGAKSCLNSKLAACDLRLTDKRRGHVETLATQHRAAFEILTDETDHQVPLSA